ncbi:MAG: hypothetical protein ABIR72_02375 [Mucilaginibacter sp.]
MGIIIGTVFLMLYLITNAKAAGTTLKIDKEDSAERDTALSEMIRSQLAKHKYGLYYPLSVSRFYQSTGFKLAFVAPETVKTHAGEAMMFLDCVIQYGLNPSDYHSKILTYERLNKLVKLGSNEGIREKAFFDMMLTDAMITLINNLHYGKLNPYHSTNGIDLGIAPNNVSGSVLQYAMAQKDFMSAVELAQPKSAAYVNLQKHMRLLTGVYDLDCYDTPDSTIRKMAINMERLRWITHDSTTYIDVNLAASNLTFHSKGSTYKININVSAPAIPTAALKTVITSFTITGNKPNHPNGFLFRLSNYTNPYIYGTTGSQSFQAPGQRFTGGNIELAQPDKLAQFLSANDGSLYRLAILLKTLKKKQVKTFNLKKGTEIVIAYLTCEMIDGALITYNDVYNLDPLLELRLYGIKNQFTQIRDANN